ncbi:MAG TPA: hypothetical protein VG711_01330 [Phycisphaerales bacterium]|nr:hypothetical protein [Phycisphaerales bacterium]
MSKVARGVGHRGDFALLPRITGSYAIGAAMNAAIDEMLRMIYQSGGVTRCSGTIA